MTAEEANKIANNPDILERHYQEILNDIKRAAENGYFTTHLRYCSDAIMKRLKQNGYEVVRDMSCGNTVTW